MVVNLNFALTPTTHPPVKVLLKPNKGKISKADHSSLMSKYQCHVIIHNIFSSNIEICIMVRLYGSHLLTNMVHTNMVHTY